MPKKPRLLVFKHKWVVAFMISHILGWTLANVQTLWIVHEVRKLKGGELKICGLLNRKRKQDKSQP